MQKEDPILFHVVHVDGDGEDLDQNEVDEALDLHSSSAGALSPQKRKAESSDEETEEEEEDDDDDEEGENNEPTETLWPSFEARNRWRRSVGNCKTTAGLAIATMALRDHTAAFGCCNAVEVTRSGRAVRKRVNRGVSFAAAREQASQWGQEPDAIENEDSDDESED